MRTAALGRVCAVLLGVALLAGCASSSRVEQVPILLEDAADLRERMDELQEQVAELTAHHEVAACRLPNRADHGWLSTGFPISPERIPASGNVNVAVLFVDFPDAPEPVARLKSFGHAATPGFENFEDDLRVAEDYLQAMSYGALDLTFRPLFKWLRMPHSISWPYSDFWGDGSDSVPNRFKNSRSLGMARSHLVADAIEVADLEFDFKDIDSVVVIATPKADSIKVGLAQLSLDSAFYPDGQKIENVISMGSTYGRGLASRVAGTTAHEVGHLLGLPDLYRYRDPDGTWPANERDSFVGVFGIMGRSAFWWPAQNEMFAWSRWQLGWLRDTQVACLTSFPGSVQLTPLALAGGIKAVVVPLTETTALVIESRRRLGYDNALGSLAPLKLKQGALVYRIDTSVRSGKGPIVVGSVSRPPDNNALLGPGEVWNSDGYSVTVKEATPEGDLVVITAP